MQEKTITSTIHTCQTEELDEVERRLIQEAISATERSYAPYSHFHVGAALLLANGEVVTGCNQENAAFPVTLCAERTALFAAANPTRRWWPLPLPPATNRDCSPTPSVPVGPADRRWWRQSCDSVIPYDCCFMEPTPSTS